MNRSPKVIKSKAELELSAQRLHQDLFGENGVTDSCQPVKRFVRNLREARPNGSGVWNANSEKRSKAGVAKDVDLCQKKRRVARITRTRRLQNDFPTLSWVILISSLAAIYFKNWV